jgi:hypothetical protein
MSHSLLLGPAAFLVAASALSENVTNRAEELNAAYWNCQAELRSPEGLTPGAEADLLSRWRDFHRALANDTRRSRMLASERRVALEAAVERDAQLLQLAEHEGALKTWEAHRDELTAAVARARATHSQARVRR